MGIPEGTMAPLDRDAPYQKFRQCIKTLVAHVIKIIKTLSKDSQKYTSISS